MIKTVNRWAAVAGFVMVSASVMAQPAGQGKATTRDIVLDLVAPQPAAAAPAQAPAAKGDAMAVSVLLESPDGSLAPRGTDKLFRTGDRFRVKLLASRSGKVSLYNTNPQGIFNPTPLWQGTVTVGQETISPRLLLDGRSGVDLLHVVLEPETAADGVVAWLQALLKPAKDGASRDIKLDVDHGPASTYLLNPAGQGLQATVQIVHQR
jgi:hypothetical protein